MQFFSIDTQIPPGSEIRRAFRLARIDDIRFRDIRQLMALSEIILDVDTRLEGHVQSRQNALNDTKWRIAALDEAQQDIADQVQERLKSAINTLRKSFVELPMYGKFVAKVQWELFQVGGTRWEPLDVDILPQTKTEPYPGMPQGIALFTDSILAERVPLPQGRINYSYLTAVIKPRKPGGILKKCIVPCALTDESIQDWGLFNKRLKGIISATVKGDSQNNDNEKKAEGMLKMVGKNSYIVKNEGIDIDLIKTIEHSAFGSFEKIIEAINNNVAIAVRGNANTAEIGKNGSFAAIEAQINGIEQKTAISDRNAFADLVNNQLLVQDWNRNVGTAFEHGKPRLPYKFEWTTKETYDKESEARIASTLLTHGARIKVSDIKEKTGFDIEGDENGYFGESSMSLPE